LEPAPTLAASRNGIFRPHRPTLPDGDPEPVDHREGQSAALKLAQTEDEEYYLHPEYLVVTMPYAEAKAWQVRLRGMGEDNRCADRLLLLETVR
jgi:hypothetical protein